MKNSDKSTQDESYEKRVAVIDSVVEAFQTLGKKNCKNKGYVVWIDTTKTIFDDLSNLNANGLTLKEELKDRLSLLNYEIGSLEFRLGKPDGDISHYTEITALDITMYLDIVTTPLSAISSGVVMKARITLAPGSPGRLAKPKGYKIDSEHTPYNIGRTVKPGSSSRINHIEIIDETSLVSRAHAHIDFNEKDGFFIQKEENKKGTNSTFILRKGEKDFELRNSVAQRNLKDGDIIKLSNWVLLEFHIINQ